MKKIVGVLATALLFAGCTRGDEERGISSEERGGSMEGAGGAGPGYDGTAQGGGDRGTVPESGQAANPQTNAVPPNAGRERQPMPAPPVPPTPTAPEQ